MESSFEGTLARQIVDIAKQLFAQRFHHPEYLVPRVYDSEKAVEEACRQMFHWGVEHRTGRPYRMTFEMYNKLEKKLASILLADVKLIFPAELYASTGPLDDHTDKDAAELMLIAMVESEIVGYKEGLDRRWALVDEFREFFTRYDIDMEQE